MSLALLFLYLMLNMFRMLIHPSSGACDLFVEFFMGCIALVRCVVVVWLWWCGIRMQAEALVPQPAYGYHTDTTKVTKYFVGVLGKTWNFQARL